MDYPSMYKCVEKGALTFILSIGEKKELEKHDPRGRIKKKGRMWLL